MKPFDPIYWARWFFIPTALLCLLFLVPCSLAFITNEWLHSQVFFWHNADFWIPCIGGIICGLSWMIIIILLAPTHKFMAGTASLLPGTWLAWHLTCFYTLIGDYMADIGSCIRPPFYLTIWAGLLGLAVMWIRSRHSTSHHTPLPAKPHSKAFRYLVLVLSMVLFWGYFVPYGFQFYRWALYHSALHSIVNDKGTSALPRVQRLARFPGFDLDWTPGKILADIPHGYALDQKVFGCPTCRQIHTPLLAFAARQGQMDVVAWMVGRRGSVEYWNDHGGWLLSSSIYSTNIPIISFLIEHGADVTATNVFGGIMHQAVMAKAPAVVMERLLSAGASVNSVSRTGLTPLDCAHIWEPQVIPFLLSHGATNSMVKVGLIPVQGSNRIYTFEGTDFGIQLPEGFSPYNRLQTPPDHKAWEVRNAANSSLSFSIGKGVKESGTNTTFRGFPAITSGEENDWGTSWSATAFVAFDTSGRSLQEIYEKGEEPHFDAMLRYQAFSRKDQIILERAFHTFFKAQKEEPRN